MTETGSIMGTAQYLSPEQAQGHAVSAQSDLYAVGIVLYEMLTGHLPFEGDTPVTIALKQVSEDPQPPSRSNPAISPDLEHVDRKSTRLNSSHANISYAVFCLKKKREGCVLSSWVIARARRPLGSARPNGTRSEEPAGSGSTPDA